MFSEELSRGLNEVMRRSPADWAKLAGKPARAEMEMGHGVSRVVDDTVPSTLLDLEALFVVRMAAHFGDVPLGDVLAKFGVPDDEGVLVQSLEGLFYMWDVVDDHYFTKAQLQQLNDLTLLPFVFGLLKVKVINGILLVGEAPSERFSEADRRLFQLVVPESVRRRWRTWWYLSEFCSNIEEMSNRAERLSAELLLHPSGRSIPAYLGLLQQAFFEGQHAICLVLCRSVLDQVVSRAMEAFCALPGHSWRDDPETMNKRLSLLQSSGYLSGRQKQKAGDVWFRGSNVVHKSPSPAYDSWPTIIDTLSVVRALEEGKLLREMS